MRTFLVLMILMNLGFLVWQQGWLLPSEPKQEIAVVTAFQQATQSLLLLSELPQGQLDTMAALVQARSSRSNAAQELEDLQQEIVAVEGKIGEVQVEIGENQEQSAAVQGAMLGALDAAIAEFDPEPILELAPEAAITPVLWCAEAGVFGDRESAEAFVAPLPGMGASGMVVEREEPISSTWWVHMPVFSSEEVAATMLKELQDKNIDSYYMRSGDMAGGISLGVYSRPESALIGQQRLADQGYAASIKEVSRIGARFYATLNLPDAALRETPDWADFLASAGGVEVSEKACETIAPENQFP